VTRLSGTMAHLAPGLLCFATVALVARRSGGWFPTTWGWAALALLFVAAAAVILLPALEVGGLDLAFVADRGPDGVERTLDDLVREPAADRARARGAVAPAFVAGARTTAT
jgi:hypothetical protein